MRPGLAQGGPILDPPGQGHLFVAPDGRVSEAGPGQIQRSRDSPLRGMELIAQLDGDQATSAVGQGSFFKGSPGVVQLVQGSTQARQRHVLGREARERSASSLASGGDPALGSPWGPPDPRLAHARYPVANIPATRPAPAVRPLRPTVRAAGREWPGRRAGAAGVRQNCHPRIPSSMSTSLNPPDAPRPSGRPIAHRRGVIRIALAEAPGRSSLCTPRWYVRKPVRWYLAGSPRARPDLWWPSSNSRSTL